MEIEDFQIGDNIEIELIAASDRLSFPCEIMKILDDGRIMVSQIVHNEKSVGFSDSDLMSFLHIGPKIHRWNNPTIKLVKYKKEVYHCVSLVGSGIPYNRRESYRLYVGSDCPLFLATSQGIERRDVLIKDISNGGVGFIVSNSEVPLPLYKQVRIHLVDDSFDMNLHLEIVRSMILEEQNSTLYGCRFIAPDAMVGRYIIKKQEKKLKEMRS